ncbi:MAG: hypothetical protein DRP46_10850 [Candidatus Zixiibacteriota bacterium]|nr:MAG: hypothetical protein DRP46_10850 [candidate division Zixibacteria bacterium]
MRGKITFIISLFVFILPLFILQCSDDDQDASPLTLAEATHKVLAEVLDNDLDSLLFYRHPDKIMPGAEFEYLYGGAPDVPYIVEKASWFFFIDDLPGARWVHPCRWILVPENGGDIEITDEQWPPEVQLDMLLYYTLDTATNLVISSIIYDSLDFKDLYYSTSIIAAGVSIGYPSGGSYTAVRDSWFFFIDDHPGLDYAHPVRYVFVEIWGGETQIYNEQFPPDIQLEMYPEFTAIEP